MSVSRDVIAKVQDAPDTNVDTISRQALIESLDAYILDETTNLNGDSVREILMDLPSVQPQRKRGKWIHDGSKWKNRWICSECGHIWMFEPAAFCDKCGAEMEEAE